MTKGAYGFAHNNSGADSIESKKTLPFRAEFFAEKRSEESRMKYGELQIDSIESILKFSIKFAI